MNIQQFYKKTASIALNASLASLIPPFFVILYGVMISLDGRLILVALPFLLYSFFCYQYYLVCDKRAKAIGPMDVEVRDNQHSLLNIDHVLIHFLPSPSLRMLLFSKDGGLLGEIRDKKLLSIRWFTPIFLDKLFVKKYGLYDESNNLIATFILKKNRIEITSEDNERTSISIRQPSKTMIEFINENNDTSIKVERSLQYMDYQFFDPHSKRITRLQKGWMPVEWGNTFKDPNTPVLSFEKTNNHNENLIIYAILSKLLH
jgi:hypothetical protein